MDLAGLISQALAITGTFNLKIAIVLFLLCSIGEIGFGLPYVLETIWLLAGYQLVRGNPPLSLADLVMIWLVAQAGRQTGSLILYYSGAASMPPLRRFYKRLIEPRLPRRQVIPACMVKHLTDLSPFSVAVGRLIGLRIPIALTMSIRQKLPHLALGVLISSLVWDGVYLAVGSTVGAAVVPKPQYMLLYSIGGLTILYLMTLGVRYFLRSYRLRKKAA